MRISSRGIVLALGCVFSLLSGCSSVMDAGSIDPDLAPQKAELRLKKQVKVAVEDFVASKPDQQKKIVGFARTGALNYPSDIVCNEPVGVIVAKAVSKGFKASGCMVTGEDEADFTVTGIVDRFWVEELVNGFSPETSQATVRYDLMIRKAKGNTIWGSTLEASKTSERALDTTDNDIPMLTQALKATVESIFANDSFWAALAKSVEEE